MHHVAQRIVHGLPPWMLDGASDADNSAACTRWASHPQTGPRAFVVLSCGKCAHVDNAGTTAGWSIPVEAGMCDILPTTPS